MIGSGYLTMILFLPAAGAVLIAFVLSNREQVIRWTAAIFTFVPLALSIILFALFDRSPEAAGLIQFEEEVLWIAPTPTIIWASTA